MLCLVNFAFSSLQLACGITFNALILVADQVLGVTAACIGSQSGRGQWSAPRRETLPYPRQQLLFKFIALFRLVAGQGAATLGKREHIDRVPGHNTGRAYY